MYTRIQYNNMSFNWINALKQGSTTTAAIIAGELRQNILHGVYSDHHPLRQEEIASQFGVSKIPVREALFQLQAEGLVDFLPGRGAAVSLLSPEEANEIYVMRIALEQVALERAVPNLQERDFIQAESLLKQIDHETDHLKWGALNWEFHTTLYRPANLPRLLETLRMWQTNVARYFFVYQALSYRQKSNQEHWAILAACRQGDAALACQQVEQHLSLASAELVHYLQTNLQAEKDKDRG